MRHCLRQTSTAPPSRRGSLKQQEAMAAYPGSDPTPDETAGMKWWSALPETGRVYWLQVARGCTPNPLPADAWEAFKRVTARDASKLQ
jgi:hypothetical protein